MQLEDKQKKKEQTKKLREERLQKRKDKTQQIKRGKAINTGKSRKLFK